ncbi:hypothetical protein [Fluviicola sp.]|jgi:hypothetical protein|uniref:hypothetical protein n=1 Tax=Fluviicola sp. TaxID=1917219 RepID=UPI0026324984|nr:hypothetical protein [Fluviicola sp.]
MKLLFILLFGTILLSSCGKERSIHIKAINAATGQPYAGLEYRVASSRTASNGEKYRTEASGVLDANGEAVVTLKQKKGRTYSVRVVEPANTCYNKEITQYFDSPYDVDGTFTFEFAPCAYLKLHVHNINCIDNNDEIKFRRLWISGGETNDFLVQTGCFQYDGDYFSLPAGNYKYEWQVTKNGVTNNYESSFQLNENQYFDFNLDY